MVSDQAEHRCEHVAVWSEDGVLLYRELEERSNQLAHHLQRLGVGPEDIVGLHLPRSVEAIVGILAVWKAGGAYCQLDPAYPAERLRACIADADVSALITSSQSGDGSVRAAVAGRVVEVDSDAALLAEQPASQPRAAVHPEHLAYVIYTSGSTGRPKGVMVSHGAIANHLGWRQSAYPLGPGDRFLHKASLSFDISVWEMFAPLCAGARLIVARPDGERDSTYLVELMARQEVTVAHAGPALLRLLLEEPALDRCTSLRQVFCGGDVVAVSLCEELLARLPVQLHHQYGPTEATVDVTCWDYQRGDTRTYVPLGVVIANTELHVFDDRGREAAPGEPGELFIGGAALARGYLGRPGATATAFVPHPFSDVPGARLYRTGDRVRRHPDGTLEFLGRRDRQVKVRGYRIELHEIEAALSRVPGLREVAVTVRARGEDEQLVAYVVPGRAAAAGSPDLSALRVHLEERLPGYMVPGIFVALDALPRTPSGKVDRRALPAPTAHNRLHPAGAAGDLQTPLERLLARLWGTALGTEPPARDAHFLALGGDSIIAVRLAARLRSAGYACTPRHLFAYPTIAALARALAVRAPAGSEHSAAPGPAVGEDRTARDSDIEDIYPLSPMQQGMLFHTLYAPASRVYREQFQLEVRGPLDRALWERAWQRVIAHHPALRTIFQWQGLPAPRQLVVRDLAAPVVWHDWRGVAPAEQTARLAALVDADLGQGFSLAQSPPMRVIAIRLEDQRIWLVWSVHHLLVDGWSAALVLDDVVAVYQALQQGREPELPAPRPYRDFIDWVHGRDHGAAASFWQRRLGAPVEPSPLPIGRTAATDAPDAHAVAHARLSAEETAQLEGIARQHRVTLNTLLVAAWALLLGRYTGRREAIFGVTVSGRAIDLDSAPSGEPDSALDGVDRMVGLFINTLAVRVDMPPGARLPGWLQNLQDQLVELMEYEQTPLVEVKRWCGGRAGSDLFDSLLVFENYADRDRRPGQDSGLVVTRHLGAARSPYPLTVTARPGAALELWIAYQRASFSAEAIERMLGHLCALLRSFAHGYTSGHPPLVLVSMLTAAEQAELGRWSTGPRIEPTVVTSYPELFAAQVARTPNAIAALSMSGDQRLTYSELAARVDRLAHLCARHGVGPERRVGVFMRRSLDLLVAVLGVLRAGGAYVPLDPDYPAERIAYVLADADVSLVLCESALLDKLPSTGARVLAVDRATRMAGAQADPGARLRPIADPGHLAYVLYTSGSTGRPKGVMISHRALLNFLGAMAREPGMDAGDVVVALTSLSFDISALELLLPLVVGARVVIAPRAWQVDSGELAAGLAAHDATIVQATPTGWQLFLQSPWPEGVRVRALCGGEAMPPRLAAALRERAEAVWNLYGPTETTIWSTAQAVTGHDDDLEHSTGHAVPIGRPIDNTAVYVLDRDGGLAPVGVPGELCIGGAGVARGYLGRPALTAERFVPDPLSATPGARMYRTGDRVRWRGDGALEFLGRIDQQLKVRGHRIEPGEIEAAMAQHPEVEAAVVTAHRRADDDVRLVAYAVPRSRSTVDAGALHEWLAAKLPAYMMPSAFLSLPELPRTPNGKIDRRALPAPDWSGRDDRARIAPAPETPIERTLAEIWRQLLGVDAPGVHDSFFALGGHSLVAVQLAMRVRAAFGVEFPLRRIFAHPTIAGMAATIQAATAPDAPIPEAGARVDLRAEAALSPDIQPARPMTASAPALARPSAILVTGATGFVGAFLVSELAARGPARILCPVRAPSRDAACARLERVFRGYGLWSERVRACIEPMPGDLAEPRMGLPAPAWRAMAARVDAIYHCAAVVNFLYPYRAVKAVNVQGTETLLRLACTGRSKALHHISTLSVFPPGRPASQPLCEDDPLERATGFRTGYAESKWVAEELVAQARQRGLPVAIYRLGAITGHSRTGAWNTSDVVCRSLKSYIQLGCMPVLDGDLDLVPVDFAARALAHISLHPDALGRVFHIANPRPAPARELHGWLHAFGYRLRSLPHERWLDELIRDAHQSDGNALFALIPLLRTPAGDPSGRAPIRPLSRHVPVDCRHTWSALAGSGIECPAVDAELVSTYLRYLIDRGFIPAPRRAHREPRHRPS